MKTLANVLSVLESIARDASTDASARAGIRQAAELLSRGRFEDAGARLIEAAQTLRATDRSDSARTLLHCAGAAYFACGHGNRAAAALDECYSVEAAPQGTRPQDSSGIAGGRARLAAAALCDSIGDPGRALQLLQQAAVSFVDCNSFPEAVHAQAAALSRVSSQAGEFSEAWGDTASELAAFLMMARRNDEAESMARRSQAAYVRALGQQSRKSLLAWCNVGSILIARGELAEAVTLMRRAADGLREFYGEQDEHSLVAGCRLAAALSQHGHLAEAEQIFQRVLQLQLTVHGEQDPRTLRTWLTLAETLKQRGDIERADQMLRDALNVLEHHDVDEDLLLTCRGYLGTTLLARGNAPGAERVLKRLIEDHQRQSSVNLGDLLKAMNNLASALLAQKKWDEAGVLQEEVVKQLRATHFQQHVPILYAEHNLATIWLMAGQPERAAASLRVCLHATRGLLGDTHPRAHLCALNLGLALLATGKPEARPEAEQILAGVLAALEVMRADAGGHVARARQSEGLSLTKVGVLLAALRADLGYPAVQVLDALERSTARSVLDLLDLNGTDLVTLGQQQVDLLRWTQDRLEQCRDACRAWDRAQRFLAVQARNWPEDDAGLRDARNQAVIASSALKEFERELIPVAAVRPLSEIQRALTPGELLLVYGWCDVAAVLVMITPHAGSEEVFVLSDDPQRLHEATEQFELIQRGLEGVAAVSDLQTAAAKLWAFLVPQRVGTRLQEASSILVVPAGPMRSTPIDLLPLLATRDPANDRVLSYVPSASALVQLRQRAIARRDRTGRLDLGAAGDPDFGGLGGGDSTRAPLPAIPTPMIRTASELADLALIFRRAGAESVDVVRGADATVDAVRRIVQGKRFIHLATHASAGTHDAPTEASLRFSPSVGNSDGALTLSHLVTDWGKLLNRCELVSLATCESSRGVTIGDTQWALSLGFLHAGADCVLGSLQRVLDAPTWLLHRRFYENLLGQFGEARVAGGRSFAPGVRIGKADALSEARTWIFGLSVSDVRRELESAPSNPTATSLAEVRWFNSLRPRWGEQPAYWGSFCLVGDPGQA